MLLGDIFPYDADAPGLLEAWLAEIGESRMVLLYEHGGVRYGAFRHWRRHQRIDRPTASELPPPPDQTVVEENSLTPEEHSRTDRRTLDERSIPRARTRASRSRSGPDSGPSPKAAAPEAHVRLSELLAAQVRERDPGAKVAPRSKAWLRATRLLVERDGRDFELVESVIRWLPSDDFWSSIVLSMPKLREKFTQLVAAMQRATNGGGRSRESASDLLAAIEASGS